MFYFYSDYLLIFVIVFGGKVLLNIVRSKERYYEWNGNTSGTINTNSIRFSSNNRNLVLDDMRKNSVYEPVSYVEFTITGDNPNKEAYSYEIVLNYGETPSNKTVRIKDSFLKFTLQEIKNGKATDIFTNRSYTSLSNQVIYTDVVLKKTSVERVYRLYMFVDSDIVIGGENASYKTSEFFNDVYASIQVGIQANQ